MNPIYIRLVERLAIVVISGLCIYWGYRLFAVATQKQGEFKLGSDFLKVHLANVAPGIYFSLFGSVVLIFAMLSKVEFTYVPTTAGDIENEGIRIARGIASESSPVVVYIDTEGLTAAQQEVAAKASELIDILSPFQESKEALGLIDFSKLATKKAELLRELNDPYWKEQVASAESPLEVFNVARAILSFVDYVERFDSEQGAH